MKRRHFIKILGAASVIVPGISQAQTPEPSVLEALKTKLSDVVESRLELEIVLPQNIEWVDGFSDGNSCTFND